MVVVLPGVDVRHDADVAVALEREVAGHDSIPLSNRINGRTAKTRNAVANIAGAQLRDRG